jgi:hypothetical protein
VRVDITLTWGRHLHDRIIPERVLPRYAHAHSQIILKSLGARKPKNLNRIAKILLVPEGTIRPVASTSTTWVNTSAGELLVPEGTIRPVVSGLLDIFLLEFTVPKSRNYYCQIILKSLGARKPKNLNRIAKIS